MQTKPVEILVFDFLDAARTAAAAGSLMKSLALHDTVYQNIVTGQNNGVRLGEPPSNFSPGPSGEFSEWDAEVPIACFARVVGAEKSNRQAALQKVFDISRLVAELFYADPTLGGRVCSSQVLRWLRGFDELEGEAYAVSNTSLIVNPSGAINFTKQVS